MPLPTEQAASYGAIIDLILQKSDLESISAKQVRRELSERLGFDISTQKEEINALIGQRFDKINTQADSGATNGHVEPSPTANGVVKSIEKPVDRTPARPAPAPTSAAKRRGPSYSSGLSEPTEEPKPKRQKKQATVEEDDAAFAARLQDEENRLARPTRGGATRRRAPAKKDKSAQKKKKKRTKSAAKVKADDDSDLEGEEEEKKERKGGFHKMMTLSQPLSDLLGETELSRPQTVKKIWEYVKARDLQDPKDKRQIRCDDALRRVFKSDKVHMFTMNKILGQNLYAQDE